MRKLTIQISFLILLVLSSKSYASIEFNGCSQSFQNLIQWSIQEIVPNLDQVYSGKYDHYTNRETGQETPFRMHINSEYRNYINWLFYQKGFVVNCWDKHLNPLCYMVEGVTPIHKQGERKKQMFLCISQKKVSNSCEMLMEFYHEFGHVAQLPMVQGHNSAINDALGIINKGDQVYAFGEAIYSFCKDRLQ